MANHREHHAAAEHATPTGHPAAAEHAAPAGHAAAAATPATPGGNSSFSRGVSRARALEHETAARVVATGQQIRGTVGRLLRFEKTAPTEVNLVKTPVYALGHMVDGIVLNTARRVYEVFEPLVSGLRAAYGATIGAVLSPLETLKSPLQYLKKPFRMMTSNAVAALNLFRAPVRAADDGVDRGINSTVQQVNFKLSRIPLIGTLLAKPTNFVTGIAAKISNAVRNAMDWVTSPVDTVHNALAPA